MITREKVDTWFKTNLGIIVGMFGMFAAFFASTLTDPKGSLNFRDKLQSTLFWITFAVILFITILVSVYNYNFEKQKTKEEEKYKATERYYAEQKMKAMEHIDCLPKFVRNKNQQMYITIEQEIIESADLIYGKFKNGDYVIADLEDWQREKLKNLKNIDIVRLRSSDLTQENITFKRKKQRYKYSYLPTDESTLEKQFVFRTVIKKTVNTFAFVIVGGLSFSIIGWVGGLINAFGIFISWFGAGASGRMIVNGTLRQRLIAKADLLSEFNTTIEKWIEAE